MNDKHRKSRVLNRKLCPACGSTDIDLWMGSKLGMIYYCKKCGYKGPVVIEEDK